MEPIGTGIAVAGLAFAAAYAFKSIMENLAWKGVKRLEFAERALEKGEIEDDEIRSILNPDPIFEGDE